MLPTSIIRLALIIIPVIAFTALGVWLYRTGGEAERIKIERQNNAAGNASDDARSAYALCVDGGGVFDFATSKCAGPKAGRRD